MSDSYVLHDTIKPEVSGHPDICIVLYTHSEYSFVWKATVPLLNKYCKNIPIYWCCDSLNGYTLPESWIVHTYDTSLSWSFRVKGCVDLIKNKYIIYLQEDWLLIDNVSLDKLSYLIDFMEKNKCEYLTSQIRQKFTRPPTQSIYPDYEFQKICGHYFQPSIWSRNLLYKILELNISMKQCEIGEAYKLTVNSICYAIRNTRFKEVATRCLFFPHIHAINSGKWTFIKFPCLKALLDAYGVDTVTRGVDNRWILDYQ